MIKGTPSPWLNLPLEKIKEMKDRYKLINDIEQQKQREEQLKKDKLDSEGQTQMEAMKDTLPFLDRG